VIDRVGWLRHLQRKSLSYLGVAQPSRLLAFFTYNEDRCVTLKTLAIDRMAGLFTIYYQLFTVPLARNGIIWKIILQILILVLT